MWLPLNMLLPRWLEWNRLEAQRLRKWPKLCWQRCRIRTPTSKCHPLQRMRTMLFLDSRQKRKVSFSRKRAMFRANLQPLLLLCPKRHLPCRRRNLPQLLLLQIMRSQPMSLLAYPMPWKPSRSQLRTRQPQWILQL